jgi:hypothetical protein
VRGVSTSDCCCCNTFWLQAGGTLTGGTGSPHNMQAVQGWAAGWHQAPHFVSGRCLRQLWLQATLRRVAEGHSGPFSKRGVACLAHNVYLHERPTHALCML